MYLLYPGKFMRSLLKKISRYINYAYSLMVHIITLIIQISKFAKNEGVQFRAMKGFPCFGAFLLYFKIYKRVNTTRDGGSGECCSCGRDETL